MAKRSLPFSSSISKPSESTEGVNDLLELRDVTFRYPDTSYDAVRGVSLTLAPGEHICLVGSNGSGKSTIAHLACADIVPDAGELIVDGSPTTDPGCGGIVALVGQDPLEQITSILVAENVSFGPRCQLLDEAEIQERVVEALEDCGIVNLAERSVSELSGGQMQLVALASALSIHPRYLVLDEATSHLDASSCKRFAVIVQSLRAAGIGILQITHNGSEASLADKILVMDDDRCVWQGTPSEWALWREQGTSGASVGRGGSIGDLGFLAAGEHRSLSLRDVSFSYGSHTVLDGFSITAAPGELVLLCGPSGSGKTTASLMLAGVSKPDTGQALLDSIPVRAGQVGLAFQRPEDQLFAPTVWDDVAYGPRNKGVADDETDRRVRQSLEAFHVPENLWYEQAQFLSGGMRHRVALASIVALAPSAFVLDEPTAGLDEEGEALLHSLVERVRTAGCPVVLVTHNPQEWASEATRTVELGASRCGASVQRAEDGSFALGAEQHTILRSPISRIDSRVRLLSLLIMTVGLFMCQSLIGMGCAVLLVGVASAFAHVDYRRLWHMLLPALPVLVAVLLANTLRIDGTADVMLTAHLGVSLAGLRAGSTAVARILLLVSMVASMMRGMSSTDIIRVVDSTLAPFARIGVHTADVSMVLSVTLSLIPQAYEEFMRIAQAQRARGAKLDEGRVTQRLHAWYAVMTPLVVVLFTRADALARAMRLRGFRGTMTLPRRRFAPRDWIALALSIAIACALAWM